MKKGGNSNRLSLLTRLGERFMSNAQATQVGKTLDVKYITPQKLGPLALSVVPSILEFDHISSIIPGLPVTVKVFFQRGFFYERHFPHRSFNHICHIEEIYTIP
jgi:hypothetical protein